MRHAWLRISIKKSDETAKYSIGKEKITGSLYFD